MNKRDEPRWVKKSFARGSRLIIGWANRDRITAASLSWNNDRQQWDAHIHPKDGTPSLEDNRVPLSTDDEDEAKAAAFAMWRML